jgi:hypothetical protein
MVKLLSVIGDRNAKKDDEIEAKSEIVGSSTVLLR